MEYVRQLYYDLSGEDVRYIKNILLGLGMYGPEISVIRRDEFGLDTLKAVCAFQKRAGFPPNGVIDRACWQAMVDAKPLDAPEKSGADEYPAELPQNIGAQAKAAISPELARLDNRRKDIIRLALGFAFDPTVPRDYPISLYIRGGNLYNKDLTPNVITLARIAAGAKSQPSFYSDGRREMMEAAVKTYPSTTGADCSGGVVGLFRHGRFVAPGFDSTADGLYRSAAMLKIEKGELCPADLVYRSGHIGLYAGGGYAVEWMGGAFGCQLTKLDGRKGFNFVTGKTANMSPWTGFLRPSYY